MTNHENLGGTLFFVPEPHGESPSAQKGQMGQVISQKLGINQAQRTQWWNCKESFSPAVLSLLSRTHRAAPLVLVQLKAGIA